MKAIFQVFAIQFRIWRMRREHARLRQKIHTLRVENALIQAEIESLKASTASAEKRLRY